MLNKITFNTGRKYTAEGQVITAEYDPKENVIHFMDHSRLINGTVDPIFALDTVYDIARTVMQRYDRYEYKWTSESADLRQEEVVVKY